MPETFTYNNKKFMLLKFGYLGATFKSMSMRPSAHNEDKNLPISQLIFTQHKANIETIEDYKNLILGGEVLTYVWVIFHNQKHYIYDGHHRAIAYAELGKLVECEIWFADRTYGDFCF